MANFFRNELGLILGILVANQFKGKIFKMSPPGFGTSQVYIPEPLPPTEEGSVYGTGRGGYYKDHDGDVGRPGLGDETIPDVTVGLAAEGGKLLYGGAGLYNGLFGEQWKINNITQIPIVSAGGGGGWYGGGWSMLGGGGGGGSSFVLSPYGWSKLSNDLRYKIISYYLSLLPEEEREQMTEEDAEEYITSFFGEWYDRTREAYLNYPWLYDLNTREPSILEARGAGPFAGFRSQLDGDGAVLISNVNEIIKYTKTKDSQTGQIVGQFSGLNKVFYYTGETQEITIPVTGLYHFIAYGGCGCDRWRGPDERYLGGFGGCASGIFKLEAGTKLYINVGSKGFRQTYRFKNASVGLGYCTGGGSSSDVRYDLTKEESRIIVAGGGGGIFAQFGDGEDPPEDDDNRYRELPTEEIKPPRNEEGEEEEKEEETRLQNMKFMVNDTSIVHVLVKSYNQIIVPDFAKTSCSIYINDGLEGELHQVVEAEGGIFVHEFQFPLNTIYPPDTPTHEVTIEAIIKTNFYSILARDGLMVWVTTDFKLTDGVIPDNRIKISNHYDELNFQDYYEVTKMSKKIITLEIEEALGINDFYEYLQTFKPDGNLYVDIMELVNIKDFYEINEVVYGDKQETEYNEVDIDDKMVISLVHLTHITRNIEELLGFEDFIELKLIDVSEDVDPEPEEPDVPVEPDEPIAANIIAKFDAINNYNGKHVNNHIWADIRRRVTVNKDELGFCDVTPLARFDAMVNADASNNTWEKAK